MKKILILLVTMMLCACSPAEPMSLKDSYGQYKQEEIVYANKKERAIMKKEQVLAKMKEDCLVAVVRAKNLEQGEKVVDAIIEHSLNTTFMKVKNS